MMSCSCYHGHTYMQVSDGGKTATELHLYPQQIQGELRSVAVVEYCQFP